MKDYGEHYPCRRVAAGVCFPLYIAYPISFFIQLVFFCPPAHIDEYLERVKASREKKHSVPSWIRFIPSALQIELNNLMRFNFHDRDLSH